MKDRFLSFITILCCIHFSSTLHAQNDPVWIYDISAWPDSAYILPVRIMNDVAHDVYVLSNYSKPLGSGMADQKILLNKFSESGQLLWSFVFDDNGGGQPAGYDMALDDAGNCYIAGGAAEPAAKPLLLKVSGASGGLVWQRDSTSSFAGSVFDRIIFSNNRLYLKAYEGVAVFDTNGTEGWSLDNMVARQMAVDYSGQMIVSAAQTGTNHNLFRYDTAGMLNFSDSTIAAERITTDLENNICLLTSFPGYELVKYYSDGNFAWSSSDFPASPPFGDIGFEVVTDHELHVLAVGLSDTMFRFTHDGMLVWKMPMNGLDTYRLTAKMAYGNFLAVAGTIQGATGYDLKVSLFNLLGAESWSGIYNGSEVQEFAVDMTAGVYGVYAIEDNNSQTTLVKFDMPYLAAINDDLVCVDSAWYDSADPSLVHVRVFNGNVSHLNYPSVQIVSPAGDTVGNPNNFVNYFAHLGNAFQVYTDTITVSGISDFTPFTFLMHELFGDSTAVMDWCQATAIGEVALLDFSVYPNPVKDILSVRHSFLTDQDIEVSVFSMTGNEVLHKKVAKTSPALIDMSGLAAGLYLLRITDGNAVGLAKVVKE